MATRKETVTIVRTPKVDRLKPATGGTEQIPIKRCIVIPRASNEADGGWVQRSGYTIYARVGADFRADDQVRVRGELYSIEGEPGRFPVKRGYGVVVTLERVAKVGT